MLLFLEGARLFGIPGYLIEFAVGMSWLLIVLILTIKYRRNF